MTLWITKIKAIDPQDGQLKEWFGPNVPGITQRDAELYCETHLGYCRVWEKLISEIPTTEDHRTPDWSGRVDYDMPQKN